MLREETVEPVLLKLLYRLSSLAGLNDFVLVGGTALSLRLGNRKSIDIDLFTTEAFEPSGLLDLFQEMDLNFAVQQMTKAALLGRVDDVKVDFICHKYPWVKPPEKIAGLTIASLEDIAAMKLNAISGSGTRLKDFVDVAFLSGYLSLSEMLNHFEQKYPNINGVVAIKSLCDFNDIDFSTKIEYTGSHYVGKLFASESCAWCRSQTRGLQNYKPKRQVRMSHLPPFVPQSNLHYPL